MHYSRHDGGTLILITRATPWIQKFDETRTHLVIDKYFFMRLTHTRCSVVNVTAIYSERTLNTKRDEFQNTIFGNDVLGPKHLHAFVFITATANWYFTTYFLGRTSYTFDCSTLRRSKTKFFNLKLNHYKINHFGRFKKIFKKCCRFYHTIFMFTSYLYGRLIAPGICAWLKCYYEPPI